MANPFPGSMAGGGAKCVGAKFEGGTTNDAEFAGAVGIPGVTTGAGAKFVGGAANVGGAEFAGAVGI